MSAVDSRPLRGSYPPASPQIAPTPAQLAAIEAAANAKIAEDAPVLAFVTDFAVARERFGFAMCDAFMPPPGPVAIAYIPDWNINLIANESGRMFASTAAVGRIEVFPLPVEGDADAGASERCSKFAKGKLELRFRAHPPAGAAAPPPLMGSPAESGFAGPSAEAVAALNPRVEKVKKAVAGGVGAEGSGGGGVPKKPAKPPAAAAAGPATATATAAAGAAEAEAAPPDGTDGRAHHHHHHAHAAVPLAGDGGGHVPLDPPDSTPTATSAALRAHADASAVGDGAAEVGGEASGQVVTPWEVRVCLTVGRPGTGCVLTARCDCGVCVGVIDHWPARRYSMQHKHHALTPPVGLLPRTG